LHRFNPDHHARLDDPERIEWQDPALLLPYLALEPDNILIDIGSGTGFFAIPLAESQPEAQIIGADISPEMTNILAKRAAEKKLKNLTAITLEDSFLPYGNDFADIVLMANVFHEFDNPSSSLADVRRILKPGGRLIIVDWDKKDTPVGPPMSERISLTDATKAVAANGFSHAAEIEIYPYNYVLVCS
jgi:ubiquinone/menaquinone biosynthesis C-methylase UbiE